MITRLFSLIPQKSSFIFGPRGTGKTTWLKTQLEAPVYLDLLHSPTFLRYSADPAALEFLIPKGSTGPVVIDEIQRIPALLNEVHRLIESRGITFILTGSSARSLRKAGVNLLAGRALTRHMYPLTAIELGDRFNLEDSIRYGHLPSLLTEPDKQAYLSSYVSTYIKEEVLQEGLTRDIGAFARFLEIASFSHAAVINYSAIAREAATHRKVVENYFSILEDLLIGSQLPVFTRRAKRKMTATPKFFFFDTGIYQTLRPKGPLDSYSEVSGPALEGLFLQDLRAINEYRGLEYQVYFWRSQAGTEVDFVIYGERGLKAFEVKHSKTLRQKDLAGLQAFAHDYPEAELYLLNLGDTIEYHGEVTVMPLAHALTSLDSLL